MINDLTVPCLRRAGWQCALSALLAAFMLYAAPVSAAPPDESGSPSGPSLFAPTKKSTPARPESGRQSNAQVPSTTKTGATQKPYVKRLDVDVQPGEDLEAAYYRYLSKNRVDPKVMRAKVRRVAGDTANKRRFEEVVAILRGALRTGQVQSWMYEALGLAMQMNDMPTDEIERTLMSAADFTLNPHELVYLSDYMVRLGFNERALEMLREVARRAPSQTEAYVRGLELGKQLKDEDAISWASLGILREEWSADQRQIRDNARRAALASIDRLRERGEKERADRFARELKLAMVRDVVVKVSWTGDADVDIMIEEPSGGVCSFRNPRTTGGGVLVGELNTRLDRSAGAGNSEIYVCPEGFAGTYRVLLRQVWGRIPAGKVAIDVWRHGGTQRVRHNHKVVPLSDEGGAMLAFDLKEGRRTDSLKDFQLANDVANTVNINRGILAQQINSIANPQVLNAQQIANQQQQPFVIGNTPVPDGRGGVGFRPEVIVLPIGATMSVNAVISADRRYVRITALPFFSNVVAVTQFNLASGVTGIDTDLQNIDIDIGGGAGDVDAIIDVGGDGGGFGDGGFGGG